MIKEINTKSWLCKSDPQRLWEVKEKLNELIATYNSNLLTPSAEPNPDGI